ncbi:hypothetical protein [Streptomyces sp. NPDC059092]|uniref:hypothetical protein n=1 Tax=Streptomyces sp. NPDC059092 TaxID=3346725 RepID=UPI00369EFCCF
MSRSFAQDPSRAPAPHPSPLSPFSSFPQILPPGATPEPRTVPSFAPLRVGGSRRRLSRALAKRRRATAAGLAVTAAALAAAGAGGAVGGTAGAHAHAEAAAGALAPSPSSRRHRAVPQPVRMVSAPVRIADAATVRLLRRGDRVDVIASVMPPPGSAGIGESGSEARVVATGARVADVPRAPEISPDGGALIVLSVPRATATALAGASATSRLAVTLC